MDEVARMIEAYLTTADPQTSAIVTAGAIVALVGGTIAMILGALALTAKILGVFDRRHDRAITYQRMQRFFPDADDDQTHSVPAAIAQLSTDLREHMADELAERQAERAEMVRMLEEERAKTERMLGRLFRDWRTDASAIIEGTPPDKTYDTRTGR